METALASTMKAVNFFATSTIPKPTTLTPTWLYTKPVMLTPYAPNLKPKNTPLFLTHCSTKPNTDTDDEIGQNSSIEHNPNSKPQDLSIPISNEQVSSSLSPSSLSIPSKGLVFDLGPTNSWDSTEIGTPVVKRFLSDDEERWYMWYYGNSNQNLGSDSVGLAVSSNGIHWERGKGTVMSSSDVGLVMNCSKDWWAFDTKNIRPSEVVIMSSTKVRASSAVYWLYYTGYSTENVDFVDDSMEVNVENPERFHVYDSSGEHGGIGKVLKSLPGLAISQDGRHWARIEGEHHSGALFDVGQERDWDSLFIASPQVVFHEKGDLRMYYHSFDVENGEFGIGIARSRDGIKWVKLGKIIGGRSGCFDEFGVKNACVFRDKKDGKYVMAYEGVGGNGGRSIGLAMSPNGLKDWRRLQDEAVLKASVGDGWDNEEVGSPCLVQMDGDVDEWRLYYRGVGNGGRTGIGMAVSEGNNIKRFKRWARFHL